MAPLTARDAETFERCMGVEGVAVFPADTVYGLACEPESKEGWRRLYALKRRPPTQPAAVLFFQPSLALAALPELGERTRDALLALLPGPGHAAAARTPRGATRSPAARPARAARSSACASPRSRRRSRRSRRSAGPSCSRARTSRAGPRRAASRTSTPASATGADLVLDGGELPGTASTIVDLTGYESAGVWTVVREGALPTAEVAARL